MKINLSSNPIRVTNHDAKGRSTTLDCPFYLSKKISTVVSRLFRTFQHVTNPDLYPDHL